MLLAFIPGILAAAAITIAAREARRSLGGSTGRRTMLVWASPPEPPTQTRDQSPEHRRTTAPGDNPCPDDTSRRRPLGRTPDQSSTRLTKIAVLPVWVGPAFAQVNGGGGGI